jgi:hypothetical protein
MVKIRFCTFGAGMIVTCHQEGNHLVRLCGLKQFEAEREEARARLYPSALGQEVKVVP